MRLLAGVVAAAALGVAGGFLLYERLDEDDEAMPRALSDWNTCVNRTAGFRISYPAGWYTDHPAPELACFYFDPRAVEFPRDDDIDPTALQVQVQGTFDEAVAAATDRRFVEILEREQLEVGGTRAVRLETETTAGAEFAVGTRTYLYVLDREPSAVIVRTTSTVGIDYGPWKRIVDDAVRTIRFIRRTPPRVEGAAVAPPQFGLPQPVARKRAQIWRAAGARDTEALARLVDPSGFQYTFGSEVRGGPAAYWERIDQTTNERPVQTLRTILELPYAYDRRSRIYVWPFAFTRKASTLSRDERELLREAITAEAFELYERFGTYLGYRAGIDERGNWVFYVAGD